MRLVDGDKLIQDLMMFQREVEHVGFLTDEEKDMACRGVDAALILVNDAPTIDAVVVVRCKNCRHYNTDVCPAGFGFCEWSGVEHMSSDDMYCSFGESK